MKKAYWIGFSAAVCMAVTGLLLRNTFHVLDILLVITGICLFLLAFGCFAVHRAPKCPHCGTTIYRGFPTLLKQKDGMIPCRRCGILVCVNHAARKD